MVVNGLHRNHASSVEHPLRFSHACFYDDVAAESLSVFLAARQTIEQHSLELDVRAFMRCAWTLAEEIILILRNSESSPKLYHPQIADRIPQAMNHKQQTIRHSPLTQLDLNGTMKPVSIFYTRVLCPPLPRLRFPPKKLRLKG